MQQTCCVTRGNFGMHDYSDSRPGPPLIGANEVLPNDAYSKAGEQPGTCHD